MRSEPLTTRWTYQRCDALGGRHDFGDIMRIMAIIRHAAKPGPWRSPHSPQRNARIAPSSAPHGMGTTRVGVEAKDRLGRHRWVVERTLAWLKRYRRLATRYERRADIHQAFLTLACCLVCHGYLKGL